MLTIKQRFRAILLGLGLAVSSGSPAIADDSEIYVGGVSTVKPNILLIIDTSKSMDADDVNDDRPVYSSGGTYGSDNGNCNGSYNRIFYTTGVGAAPPTCASANYINGTTTYQNCDKLRTAVSGASGRWTGKAAQYNSTSKVWEDLKTNGPNANVECAADSGFHGETTASTSKYARNNNASKWGDSTNVINWSQRTTYTFYSERWVRYNQKYDTTPAPQKLDRLAAVKQAVFDMVSSIDDVNMGVMRFNGQVSGNEGKDSEYQGGSVVFPIRDVTMYRNDIVKTVSDLATNSGTPLSETLHEAGLYWGGGAIRWGGGSHTDAKDSSDTSKYKSPIGESCQRNFNILLTDGRPTWDNQDDKDIEDNLYKGACTGTPGDTSLGPGNDAQQAAAGRCLDEMSTYLARDTTDLRTSLDGSQRVKTFTIGFGGTDTSAFDFLTEVANDGGGVRYLANDTAKLNKALTDIATEISNISSTFASASIGVNSFNRATTRDDLYFAVFNSDDHIRWDGNLKKYKLYVDDPDGPTGATVPKLLITGDGLPKVDAVNHDTGFFKDGVQSYWSAAPDGNKVTEGGAASKLKTGKDRTVYTYLGANPAGSFANVIAIDDAAVTAKVLDVETGTPDRDAVIAFAKGTPKRMGDPLHSQPQVVTYSGSITDPNDVVYVATNDGYLHAVDAKTGVEKWAFIPQELLTRLKTLVTDPAATNRTYGLDGDIRIIRLDKDSDGVIESTDGDVVWLYVGMRRGGSHYYALDVTNQDSPKLMWSDGPTELPGVGETWSPPSIARVEVSGATQNNQKLVLIFGGGYDADQENNAQTDDNVGNAIYMVDAKSGVRLWSIGSTDSHSEKVAWMTNSITGRVSVIDINGDGYIDRMYASDLGGRVFRFDVFSGSKPGDLVTGSVFAALGDGKAAGGSNVVADTSSTRRFYYAPDVALIQRRGADPYYNIAIGSGYRGHPLHKPTYDRFYSLRDKAPFAKFDANDKVTTLTEATTGVVELTAANVMSTTVAASAPGWYFVFDPTGTSTTATGQKVLNESTTVNGVILFSTYQPQEASSAEPCRPSSLNRVYALRVDDGRPALDLNNDGVIDAKDLFESVKHEGILGGVNVGVLRGKLADEMGGTPTVCLAGMHILGKCVGVSDSIRTYWRRKVD
jgi:type IV pilus assembly protein PilY1